MRRLVSLVVLGFITVITTGFLIIGIQSMRRSADQADCQNNLKYVIFGLHNYESTYQELPRASMPNANLPPEKRLSWLVAIVDFFAATKLSPEFKYDKPWDGPENGYLAYVTLRTYECPGFPSRRPQSTIVPAHFIGMTGIGADAAELPENDPRAGVFGYERKAKLGNMYRGNSNVLCVMETARVSAAWTAGGWPTARGLENGDSPLLGRAGQFGGIHRGGTNTAWGDGSVRFVRNTIDPNVIKALVVLQGTATNKLLDD